jgi:iron complex outermembrane receptor protein
MQVFDLVPYEGLSLTVLSNAPRAHTTGAELSLSGKPLPGLTLSTGLGLLSAKIDRFVMGDTTGASVDYAGHTLPLAPAASFVSNADYAIPLPGATLRLHADAEYRSRQFFDLLNDPLITQRGYWLENLRLAYASQRGRWELAGFVHNLSGQKYLTYGFDGSSTFGFLADMVGPPRSFGMEFSYNR